MTFLVFHCFMQLYVYVEYVHEINITMYMTLKIFDILSQDILEEHLFIWGVCKESFSAVRVVA